MGSPPSHILDTPEPGVPRASLQGVTQGGVDKDNLSNRSELDCSKLNMHEAHGLKYSTGQLGVTREVLQQTVEGIL